MSVGFAAEAGLSAALNSVVLYSLGEPGAGREAAGEGQQQAVTSPGSKQQGRGSCKAATGSTTA